MELSPLENVEVNRVRNLIERQDALDILDDLDCHAVMYTERGVYERACWKMRKPQSAQPRWIPCDDELPFAEYGESDTVLATCGYRDAKQRGDARWLSMLYFNGGVWCYPTGKLTSKKYTHGCHCRNHIERKVRIDAKLYMYSNVNYGRHSSNVWGGA